MSNGSGRGGIVGECISRPVIVSDKVISSGKAPGIGNAVADDAVGTSGRNILTRRAAAAFLDLSDLSSCFNGSLLLPKSQFGSGRLNIADLSELESDGFLELDLLAPCCWCDCFGGILMNARECDEEGRFVFDVSNIGVGDVFFVSVVSTALLLKREPGEPDYQTDRFLSTLSVRVLLKTNAVSTTCNGKTCDRECRRQNE